MPRPLPTIEELTAAQRDALRRFPSARRGGQFDQAALQELREMQLVQDDHGVDELTPPGRELQWQLLNAVMLPPLEP